MQNFVRSVRMGKRLTLDEIGALDDGYRRQYRNVMLDTDKEVTSYLNKVKKGARASREEKAQLLAEIKKVHEEWDEQQAEFDQKMESLIIARQKSEKAAGPGLEGHMTTEKI